MTSGKQLTVTVTALIGLVAVVLGSIGYHQAFPGRPWIDDTYQGIQLLALEYNGPEESPPGILQVGRYLGALALSLAVLLVLGAIARDRLNNFLIRYGAHDHIVVVGLGERGTTVSRGLEEAGMGRGWSGAVRLLLDERRAARRERRRERESERAEPEGPSAPAARSGGSMLELTDRIRVPFWRLRAWLSETHQRLSEARTRIVAIDNDPDARARVGPELDQISFVEGDALAPKTYATAAIARARHVVIAAGDDSLNLQAMEVMLGHLGLSLEDAQAAGSAGTRSAGPGRWRAALSRLPLIDREGRNGSGPTIHVLIADEDFSETFQPQALRWAGEGAAIEYVSIARRAGLAMAEAAAAELRAGCRAEGRDLVVVGRGRKAKATATHAARLISTEGSAPGDADRRPAPGTPSLVLAGPATQLEGELRPLLAAPDTGSAAAEGASDYARPRLRCVPGVPSDDGYEVAFVVGLDHADALQWAAELQRKLNGPGSGRRTRIFVDVPRAGGRVIMRRSGLDTKEVTSIDAEERVLAVGLLENSTQEILARAKHADYVRDRRSDPKLDPADPSLRDWRELPEALKESNRAFARSIGPKLAEIGARIRPQTGSPRPLEDLVGSEAVDALAAAEHERWMAEREAAGWRYGPARDPDRRRNPLMVPWGELEDSDRRYNHETIDRIPMMLAKLGYEIEVDPADAGEGPAEAERRA